MFTKKYKLEKINDKMIFFNYVGKRTGMGIRMPSLLYLYHADFRGAI